jgi:hypothetical protein
VKDFATMREDLKDIFKNVNEWLKFAEAKHAGLIVLNTGAVFGILTSYKDYKQHIPWIMVLIIFFFLGLSMAITLISLFPKTGNKIDPKKKPQNPNLYFFGSLSQLDVNDFKTEIGKSNPNYNFNRLDDDLINQILVNSSIATRKYKLFKLATIATIIGISTPLFFIISRLLCRF